MTQESGPGFIRQGPQLCQSEKPRPRRSRRFLEEGEILVRLLSRKADPVFARLDRKVAHQCATGTLRQSGAHLHCIGYHLDLIGRPSEPLSDLSL